MTSVLQPRECTVTKKPQKSYGFYLRIEKDTAGHLIRNVEKNSPAEKAGLKDGDRVLRVNGVFVDKEEHAQVVEIVKNSGNSVVLLVLDDASYQKAEKEGVNLEELGQKVSTGQQQEQQSPLPMANGATTGVPQPRLCYLVKEEKGYGFSLKTTEDHVIKDVDSGSPAAEAGLKDNDILVAVNGEQVDGLDHESVVGKIKQSEAKTTLLVVDKETEAMYKLAQISPFSYYYKAQDPAPAKTEERVELHTEQKMNHKPRICKMVKGPSGFGFSLNMIKNKPGLFISEVQNHGPADAAGVENNNFLVEVNGVNVINESYDKVVARIQDSGDRLTLLVCSKDAYKYFQGQNIPITVSMADPAHDTSEPPAYTENNLSKPERHSPEPRERASSSSSSQSAASTRADSDNDDTKL
ncbi:Na(+)/H(+) exchange regulatory cofactor NHE-RF3 isoform X2 [Harpia harpyja]|uniref:Na(+)/H(+) exchange regulatory cofactor NHE-RF3 isoform X2 n=1 Tax=Harpia harpyja TaxID=202280 RepID=UPI0022B0F40C|nr:Na(+)/H(+) exchange regulatory cofactor NHE-RF3 isoform X2 [Harpia harpyja]